MSDQHVFESAVFRQIYAMVTKQSTLLKRNKCQLFCTIVMPIALLGLLVFVTTLENNLLSSVGAGGGGNGPTLQESWSCADANFNGGSLTEWSCFQPLSWDGGFGGEGGPGREDINPIWRHIGVIGDGFGYRETTNGSVLVDGWISNYRVTSNYTATAQPPTLDGQNSYEGTVLPPAELGTTFFMPYMSQYDGVEALLEARREAGTDAAEKFDECNAFTDNRALYEDPVLYEAWTSCKINNYGFGLLVPDTAYVVRSADGVDLDYDVYIPAPAQSWNEEPGTNSACAQAWDFEGTGICERVDTTRYIAETVLRNITGEATQSFHFGYNRLPYAGGGQSITLGFLSDPIAALLMPIALTFMQPLVAFEVITERQEGLREMMAMMGLRSKAYWISQFAWNSLLYYATFGLSVALALVSGMHWITAGNMAIPLTLFALYGPASIGFGYFIAQVFSSTRKQLIFHYMILTLIAPVAFYGVNSQVFSLAAPSPWFLFLIPQFALMRGFHIWLAFLGHSGRDPINLDGRTPTDFNTAMTFMVIDAVGWILVSLYLDAVYKHGKGAGRPVLFPVYSFLQLIGAMKSGADRNVNGDNDDFIENEDEDVIAERELIKSGKVPKDSPLFVNGLRKLYPGSGGSAPKLALANFSLHMVKGEVLTMLGPNGAGKSTLMNMLVGVHAPTGGEARISGYDIKLEMHKVRGRIGVVQQFDVLFAQLTCMEHCIFYCRVQGIDRYEESRVASEALKLVGLQNSVDTRAHALSGGMRRRLSIAITMCGDPKLIFMDEPTTGLDPGSRRSLWDIVRTLSRGRSIMLSTHMMDEAEALSDRVCIMAKGRMVALGTPQHLKAKFGNGYSLSVSYTQGGFSAADQFVKSLSPSAALMSEFPGVSQYNIPPPIVLSEIFKRMEEQRGQAGIRSWGVNQASLEDVFLNIIHDEDMDGAAAGASPA